MNDTFQGITKEAGEEAKTERSYRSNTPSWLNALPNFHKPKLLPSIVGYLPAFLLLLPARW